MKINKKIYYEQFHSFLITMLKKLLTQNNFTELENAIKNKDFDLMVITCSNLSILKTHKLQSDSDIFDRYFNSEEINNTLYNHKIFDSNRISESKSSVTMNLTMKNLDKFQCWRKNQHF